MSHFTLKIRWARHGIVETDPIEANVEPERIVGLVDETTLFIPADQVRVHGDIPAGQRHKVMKHWHGQSDDGGYHNYLSVTDIDDPDGECATQAEMHGRLICVILDGEETWYTATHAWLLGPDGGTIERVAP